MRFGFPTIEELDKLHRRCRRTTIRFGFPTIEELDKLPRP